MDWPVQCAAVIPCLNEQQSIQRLVTDVHRHLATVIVVDDGSTDETARLARQAGAEVVGHEKSLGKGAALQTGWRHALDRGFAWTLTLDGDGQHSPEDIPSFFACAERSSISLVVGNRMGSAAAMPPLRRFVNRWMSQRLSRLT